ncbi:MAG: beta-galactosidase [Anaerolineaceae bacterium]|nr:beta-galactosidase [Anaerolineaceae bacterium]
MINQKIDMMPQLIDLHDHKALFVNGKPYLILGIQLDCDDCFSFEPIDTLFPHAKEMGCNTIQPLLYWRTIEPEEGKYNFVLLDHLLEQARKNGLKIVLNWFGTYKNQVLFYAPDYVRTDPVKYPRMQWVGGNQAYNCSCPTALSTFQKDKAAVVAVFQHLMEIDVDQHTVIAFQIENESGLLASDRCYCPRCNEKFLVEKWEEKYMQRAAEAFTAQCIARFEDDIAKEIKAIYPLPLYVNAAPPRPYKCEQPGRNYPSGGPVPNVFDIYRNELTSIDFIAPDIYDHGYQAFHALCDQYSSWVGHPLYIAEHSTGKGSRAEKNVFYAIAEYSAIGFDPWSIDRSFPNEFSTPLVNYSNGKWSEEAFRLKESYKALGDAIFPIATAQNTSKLRHFVQESGDKSALVRFENIYIEIDYMNELGDSRGIVIQAADTEFIFVGIDFKAGFFLDRLKRIDISKVERGKFQEEKWIPMQECRMESPEKSSPFFAIGPGVYKVSIDL